jgi:hypothetical protein
MAAKDIKLTNEVAPKRENAEIGTELLCANYEGAIAPVLGKIVGKDDKWVRLRIEELGRDWLVRPDRIDMAKGSWEHVDADYPRLGDDAAFDAEFRPVAVAKEDPIKAKAIADATATLKALIPSAAKILDSVSTIASDRLNPGPAGSVLARWTGKGQLDAAYLTRTSHELKRPAVNGTEGWFAKKTVEKFPAHFEML